MIENHMLADTPDAPWNQVDQPEQPFKSEVVYTMTKVMDIYTDQYTEDSGVEWNPDGNEYWFSRELDKDADLISSYREQEYTPIDLLEELKFRIVNDLNGELDKVKIAKLKSILNSIEGWKEFEIDIEQK